MKNFILTREIIQKELDSLKSYSELSIVELSKKIDIELSIKLHEKQLFMFSKRDTAELIHITTKTLNNLSSNLPEIIQFKNTRSLLSFNIAIHFYFTPFIISRLKHKNLSSIINEIAKL